jgi:hypothetical protein
VFLGDKVNPGVGCPSIRPIRPKPHFAEAAAVLRCVAQVPKADALELPPTPYGIGIEPREQASEAQRDAVGGFMARIVPALARTVPRTTKPARAADVDHFIPIADAATIRWRTCGPRVPAATSAGRD